MLGDWCYLGTPQSPGIGDLRIKFEIIRPGAVCIFIGIFLILRPFSVILDVIPLMGNIAEFGTGLAVAVVSLFLSLLIIAVAWFSYRPLVSACLIGAAVVSILLIGTAKKHRAAGCWDLMRGATKRA